MTLVPGDRLGAYEIVGPLGAGGMGEVYTATDTRLRRSVALKLLPATHATDPDRLRRFKQEALAAAALSHPNILAVYDIGADEHGTYLVSELLEGYTLREPLLHGALPLRKTLDYAIQIAYGLAAAHEKAIVHRDLKPENVFVTRDGRVKILDFGLAKLRGTADGNLSQTQHSHQTSLLRRQVVNSAHDLAGIRILIDLAEEISSVPITLVVNWTANLKR